MVNFKEHFKKASLALRQQMEVVGDDDDIKREFERIDNASSLATNIRLIKAYEKFEQIAEELDVSIQDIINAQAKSPSTDIDGL